MSSEYYQLLFDALIKKGEWEPTDTYHASNLNTVEELTNAVREKIAKFKNKVLATPQYNISRNATSIEFAEDLNRIETNILVLAQELNFPTGFITPNTSWSYNAPFSYVDANRLEHNLIILNNYVTGQLNARPFCGQYIVWQEGVI